MFEDPESRIEQIYSRSVGRLSTVLRCPLHPASDDWSVSSDPPGKGVRCQPPLMTTGKTRTTWSWTRCTVHCSFSRPRSVSAGTAERPRPFKALRISSGLVDAFFMWHFPRLSVAHGSQDPPLSPLYFVNCDTETALITQCCIWVLPLGTATWKSELLVNLVKQFFTWSLWTLGFAVGRNVEIRTTWQANCPPIALTYECQRLFEYFEPTPSCRRWNLRAWRSKAPEIAMEHALMKSMKIPGVIRVYPHQTKCVKNLQPTKPHPTCTLVQSEVDAPAAFATRL